MNSQPDPSQPFPLAFVPPSDPPTKQKPQGTAMPPTRPQGTAMPPPRPQGTGMPGPRPPGTGMPGPKPYPKP